MQHDILCMHFEILENKVKIEQHQYYARRIIKCSIHRYICIDTMQKCSSVNNIYCISKLLQRDKTSAFCFAQEEF